MTEEKQIIKLESITGKCPICNYNLDGGDIVESLARLDIYANTKPETLMKLAYSSYGYSEENRSRFTKLKHVVGNILSYYQCPTCNSTYDVSSLELLNRGAVVSTIMTALKNPTKDYKGAMNKNFKKPFKRY